MADKKLVRSKSNKMISGFCAGLAQYFGIDPTIVRLGYAALTLFTAGFPGIILYILGMLVVPEE